MWYSGFSSEAAQEDEGHAHVLPLQIPVLPQMGILLQGPAGSLVEDAKPFPRHHSGDAPLLLLGQQAELNEGIQGSVIQLNEESLKSSTIIFSTIPILVVYPWLQKYFVKGVMVGAVKG